MRYFTFILILFTTVSANSQEGYLPRSCTQVWITTYSSKLEIEGKLIGLEQNSLSVLLASRNTMDDGSRTVQVPVPDIREFSFRDNRRIGKGAMIGALAGAGIGIITGFVSNFHNRVDSGAFFDNDHPPLYVTVVRNGAIGAVVGAGIGAAIGAARFYMPINGDPKNLASQRARLEKQMCLD